MHELLNEVYDPFYRLDVSVFAQQRSNEALQQKNNNKHLDTVRRGQ